MWRITELIHPIIPNTDYVEIDAISEITIFIEIQIFGR